MILERTTACQTLFEHGYSPLFSNKHFHVICVRHSPFNTFFHVTVFNLISAYILILLMYHFIVQIVATKKLKLLFILFKLTF